LADVTGGAILRLKDDSSNYEDNK